MSTFAGHGALAQLGERLLCKHQVIGSIPIGSTTPNVIQFDEEKRFAVRKHGDVGSIATLFDIVNGFLKSMPWCMDLRRRGLPRQFARRFGVERAVKRFEALEPCHHLRVPSK